MWEQKERQLEMIWIECWIEMVAVMGGFVRYKLITVETGNNEIAKPSSCQKAKIS